MCGDLDPSAVKWRITQSIAEGRPPEVGRLNDSPGAQWTPPSVNSGPSSTSRGALSAGSPISLTGVGAVVDIGPAEPMELVGSGTSLQLLAQAGRQAPWVLRPRPGVQYRNLEEAASTATGSEAGSGTGDSGFQGVGQAWASGAATGGGVGGMEVLIWPKDLNKLHRSKGLQVGGWVV
jgi:hypothetical protein